MEMIKDLFIWAVYEMGYLIQDTFKLLARKIGIDV